VSMETTTSSIIVLRPSFDDDSSFLTSMVVLEDQIFLGMIFHTPYLTLSDRFWMVSDGCRGEVCHCKFVLDCYVLVNVVSCSWNPLIPTMLLKFVFPGILVVILLLMLVDCFIGYVARETLILQLKIKIMEKPSWYL
jgi:hypothetical protein